MANMTSGMRGLEIAIGLILTILGAVVLVDQALGVLILILILAVGFILTGIVRIVVGIIG